VTSQLLLELEPPPAPTLANFAVGRNGAVVEAVAQLAATPGILYLWGEAGSGKSHLVAAARTGAGEAPFAAFDDTDRLTEAAQIEAFDLFNRVRAAGGSVIAAGRAAPAALPLREDLRSRLLSGLAFQLQPLADAEKAAALAAHAAARGMKLPAEAVDHLLARLPRDLGTQFAVLDAVDRYSLALKRPVTLPLVRAALRALDLA
jgi:DnaA-homolog protein